MSIITEILTAFPDDVRSVQVDKNNDLHGEVATQVMVNMVDGRSITGHFTTEQKSAFGGVVFSQQKDISALMTAKVRSVLKGTAE